MVRVDAHRRATAAAVLTACAMLVRLPAQTTAPLKVSSPSFAQDQPVPKDFTPDGRNISPALNWTGAPAMTREFAVILEDPDAGNPPPYVHWLIYKIPPTAKGLPENVPIDPAT